MLSREKNVSEPTSQVGASNEKCELGRGKEDFGWFARAAFVPCATCETAGAPVGQTAKGNRETRVRTASLGMMVTVLECTEFVTYRGR